MVSNAFVFASLRKREVNMNKIERKEISLRNQQIPKSIFPLEEQNFVIASQLGQNS